RKSRILLMWAPLATDLLYADIVLRRMGQITALAHTLRTQPSGDGRSLSMLARSLRIDSCVVWQECEDVVREDLEFLLCECTCLRAISFHANPLLPFVSYVTHDVEWDYTVDDHDVYSPSWIVDRAGRILAERLVSGLSVLDLTVPLNDSQVFHVMIMLRLSHATHLTSLSLGPVFSGVPPELVYLPPLHLPALTTLQVTLAHQVFTEHITTRWRLPKLTALTCIRSPAVPIPLLAKFGAKLTYLHL
ncbi:hypothetical protein C8T65DRAFT_522014, partial [Cerioporus squamosus]